MARTRTQKQPPTGLALARAHNRARIAKVDKDSQKPDAVSAACMESYRKWLAANPSGNPLQNLTHHLVSTSPATEASIRARMTARWQGEPNAAQKTASSITNSLRRSAGTNYQTLVSYALATYLDRHDSHWYVQYPIPSELGNSLAIKFTGGAQTDAAPEANADDASTTVEEIVQDELSDAGEAVEDATVVVKPDLDILIRNASWNSQSGGVEPVLVMSVKTSLADRAGSAARWKTYFDLVTQPCEHICEDSCAYRRLGIELAHQPNVRITHAIVTANIYKINSDPYFTRWGELRSNQAKSNTFMFDRRFTTREESEEVMAPGWASLTEIAGWLAETSSAFGLPD